MADEYVERETTLGEFIEAAVQAYVGQGGRAGMSVGFVAMVEFVDDDGEMTAVVARPDKQQPWRSLGYVEYLNEWYRDDVRNQILACVIPDDDEE